MEVVTKNGVLSSSIDQELDKRGLIRVGIFFIKVFKLEGLDQLQKV